MERSDILNGLALESKMEKLIRVIIGLEWDDDNRLYRYIRRNDFLNWDEYEFIEFKTPFPYEDDLIDGILFFGDATIEFHFQKSCEAENWATFDIDTITRVKDCLEECCAN